MASSGMDSTLLIIFHPTKGQVLCLEVCPFACLQCELLTCNLDYAGVAGDVMNRQLIMQTVQQPVQ